MDVPQISRAVARFCALGGGGGGEECLNQESFSGCEFILTFLEGPEHENFSNKWVRDWLKVHFSRFQLGKLDKNMSARSLALQFGRCERIVCWLGGGGGGGAIEPYPH